jgi:hypothetical protein
MTQYTAPDTATTAPSAKLYDWLSPRRAWYARLLFGFLCEVGDGRRLSDAHGYKEIKDNRGMDQAAVDLAIDDLFECGAVEVHLIRNTDTQVVTRLVNRIEVAR